MRDERLDLESWRKRWGHLMSARTGQHSLAFYWEASDIFAFTTLKETGRPDIAGHMSRGTAAG